MGRTGLASSHLRRVRRALILLRPGLAEGDAPTLKCVSAAKFDQGGLEGVGG